MRSFEVTLQPPHSLHPYSVRFDGARIEVTRGGTTALVGEVETLGQELRLRTSSSTEAGSTWIALDALMGHSPELLFARVDKTVISRHQFYQVPFAWHRDPEYRPEAEAWITTNERSHPRRPVFRAGVLYRRYAPSIGRSISFRTVDPEKDLDLFHAWHHKPRVYDLWELNKPKEKLKAYLENGLRDPHQIPLIVEFDGRPVGYFELYWVAEDRLGPYYDVEPFDRGFHFLIGEESALGAENTGQVVRSVMHLCFLEDARTRRIAVEPRADNQRVIKYSLLVPGWKFIKEFDFPHKRAALLMAKREDFFVGGAL